MQLAKPDPIVPLGPTADRRRVAYRALFQHQMEADSLRQIRRSLNDGLVLGAEGFKKQIENTLHRLLQTPVRGRPRKFFAEEPLFNSYYRFGSQK